MPIADRSRTRSATNGEAAAAAARHQIRGAAPVSGPPAATPPPDRPTPPPLPEAAFAAPLPPLWPLLAALLVGLLIGGIAGGAMSKLSSGGHTAAALVQTATTSDPGLAAIEPINQTATSLEGFFAGEFAFLSSDGYGLTAAQKAGTGVASASGLQVARVGQSTVVRITATLPSATDALALVKAAVDVYTAQRDAEFTRKINDSQDSLKKLLADAQSAPAGAKITSDQQARIDRLQSTNDALVLAAASNTATVPVLDPPAILPDGSSTTLSAVLGAILGGLLAVGAVQLLRRGRARSISSSADAALLADQVLLPEINLTRGSARASIVTLAGTDFGSAQMLSAQIAARRPMGGRIIAVVGVSAASATTAVARRIAVGSAQQAAVLLGYTTTHGQTESDDSPLERPAVDNLATTMLELPNGWGRRGLDARWMHILDAAAVEHRCVVLDLGTAADVLPLLPPNVEPVLVLGAGADDVATSAAVAAAVHSGSEHVMSVVTRGNGSLLSRLFRRRSPDA